LQGGFFGCKIALVNKEEILEEFFRSLRVALTNAFSYSKDHPYFIKSVENFKLKLEATLAVLDPLKIGVTSSGLVVDEKNLTRSGFYDELALLLHRRKIKNIDIRSGASLEELVKFLSVISLPQKDIFRNGGINALLGKEQLTHFIIEELDYSVLLHGEGQECADIWGYMLKEAAHSNDAAKLDRLADDFGPLINRVNEKDLLDAEGISSEVNEFLACLRDKNKEKFDKCARDVFLWLLRNKKYLNPEKLARLKPIFNGLNKEDFSTFLWEGLLQEDNFDTLSLQLFSKISGQENQPKIAESFFHKMNETQGLKDNPGAVKKIRNLLSSAESDTLSAVYRNTLESLVKNISFSGKLLFDQKGLKENYRYIVLGMFSTDKNKDILQTTAAVLEKELAGAFENDDLGFLKDLWGVLVKRKNEGIDVCTELEEKLSAFIENIVLNSTLPAEKEFLLEMVSFPSQEQSFYLDKIFTAEKVNKQILNLFLRLFQSNLDAFYARVESKLKDIEFVASLIDALGNAPATLGILEYIYSSANDLIRLEVLEAMRKFKAVDVEFLTLQLRTGSLLLKKSLLSVLILDAQAKDAVLDLLFEITSPWGSKNRLLIENMQIVFDLKFIQAASRIKNLSSRRFFWNSQLRNKAAAILKEWNVS